MTCESLEELSDQVKALVSHAVSVASISDRASVAGKETTFADSIFIKKKKNDGKHEKGFRVATLEAPTHFRSRATLCQPLESTAWQNLTWEEGREGGANPADKPFPELISATTQNCSLSGSPT